MDNQMTLDQLIERLLEIRAYTTGEALVTFTIQADEYYRDKQEPLLRVFADGAVVVMEGQVY